MSFELEFFIWTFLAFVGYLWIAARVRRAVNQIRREEFLREVLRRAEQKRKIDVLYGRDKD